METVVQFQFQIQLTAFRSTNNRPAEFCANSRHGSAPVAGRGQKAMANPASTPPARSAVAKTGGGVRLSKAAGRGGRGRGGGGGGQRGERARAESEAAPTNQTHRGDQERTRQAKTGGEVDLRIAA
jgi:hypothetical protein